MKIEYARKQVISGSSLQLMANRYANDNIRVKRRKGETTKSYVSRWNESFDRLYNKALNSLVYKK